MDLEKMVPKNTIEIRLEFKERCEQTSGGFKKYLTLKIYISIILISVKISRKRQIIE